MPDNPKYIDLAKRIKKLKETVCKQEKSITSCQQGELSKREALFSSIFDHMPSASAVYEVINDGSKGSDYIIREFNSTSLKIEGRTIDQVTGKSLLDLQPDFNDYGLLSAMKCVWETGIAAYYPVEVYNDKKLSHYYENYIFKIPSGELVTICNDLTEHKNIEFSLKESKERFELAMKFSNDGLFDWNLETNQIYYSRGWKKILGYQDHEIHNDFSEWSRLTRPEDVNASWSMLNDVLECKRDRFEMEFQMLHKNGHWVDILSRANVIFNENGKGVRVVGTHVDITERKKAEREILQQKLKAERYLNLAGVMFIGLDKNGNITIANKKACDILEYDESEIIGRNWFDNFIPQTIRQDVYSVFKQLIDGNVEPVEYYINPITSKSGKEKYIDWHNTYIKDDAGKIIGILSSGEDITEKRVLEAQLQKAQKMESIGNLAGGIAHDFNNLLFPIIGMSELLLEDLPKGTPEHEKAQEILKAAIRGSDLVKQILAFSRQSDHKKTHIYIQQVLKEALKLSRSTIPSDIEIAQEIQANCGMIMADPTQMHQVAMNLITNAYHAIEQQPDGKISVNLKETVLGPYDLVDTPLSPGRYAVFSVSDTGCGIDPAISGKIFEPYFTTKEKEKGTGLGLAVVYGIVKEHKGDIKVISSVGKGTTFDVYLPLTERDIASDSHIQLSEAKTGTERILLVDDEESVVKLEKIMLERLGYLVTETTSSLEALNAFRADPDIFDLIISDMTMPNMTGDQLIRKIREIRSDIPTIICTGFSERLNQDGAKSIGISGFLMKPIVKSELAQMVRDVLDQTRENSNDKNIPGI